MKMNESMKADKEQVLEMIDEMSSPAAMSAEAALEWLQEIEEDVQARIDALREDNIARSKKSKERVPR